MVPPVSRKTFQLVRIGLYLFLLGMLVGRCVSR